MFNQIIQISAQIEGKRALDFKIVRGSIPPPPQECAFGMHRCLRHLELRPSPFLDFWIRH